MKTRGELLRQYLLISFCIVLFGSMAYAQEKIGVIVIGSGESELYSQYTKGYFDHLFPFFPPGFFAGGPLEPGSGDCYSLIHYASDEEAAVCTAATGVTIDPGTPIDIFCREYTDNDTYPIHSIEEHSPLAGGGSFDSDCYDYGEDLNVAYLIQLGHETVNPVTGEVIVGPHIDNAGSPDPIGIGVADFVEMDFFNGMENFAVHYKDGKDPYRGQLMKWWYGNEIPSSYGYPWPADAPERINVLDRLRAVILASPEIANDTQIVFRHAWEAYMENKNIYETADEDISDSMETALNDLIVNEQVDRVIVMMAAAQYSNITTFGHCWQDENGAGVSRVDGKTYYECVTELDDPYGPVDAETVARLEQDKPWENYRMAYPDTVHLFDRIVGTRPVTLSFTKSYSEYADFKQGVVQMIRNAVTKFSIPNTASLKVILANHGYDKGYLNGAECDSYYRDATALSQATLEYVSTTYLATEWAGPAEVVQGEVEYAQPGEGNLYDPPSVAMPFGEILGVGEQIDMAINGRYVNELGETVDNGVGNFDYVIVIPVTWDAEGVDTIKHMRGDSLGNNEMESLQGQPTYVRQHVDQDGDDYDGNNPLTYDNDYYTVRSMDASGWATVPVAVQGVNSFPAECTEVIVCIDSEAPECSQTVNCDNDTLVPGSNPPICTYSCWSDPDPVPKGIAGEDATTVILSGTFLSVNNDISRGLYTDAAVDAIIDAIINPAVGGYIDESCMQATLITLSEFKARGGNKSATLTWSTASEVDNAGFNILRAESESGPYQRVNGALIRAQGSPASGADYEYTDHGLDNRKTYYYQLEDIDLNGLSVVHGPISVTPRLVLGLF